MFYESLAERFLKIFVARGRFAPAGCKESDRNTNGNRSYPSMGTGNPLKGGARQSVQADPKEEETNQGVW
jgi:hypothetical protein